MDRLDITDTAPFIVPFIPPCTGLVVTTKHAGVLCETHCRPAASAATTGGVWVLPDEYRNFGDAFMKNVSGISAMTGSTANPLTVLRQSTAFGEFRIFLP